MEQICPIQNWEVHLRKLIWLAGKQTTWRRISYLLFKKWWCSIVMFGFRGCIASNVWGKKKTHHQNHQSSPRQDSVRKWDVDLWHEFEPERLPNKIHGKAFYRSHARSIDLHDITTMSCFSIYTYMHSLRSYTCKSKCTTLASYNRQYIIYITRIHVYPCMVHLFT